MFRLAAAFLLVASSALAQVPLPSWNDTQTRTAILDFVESTTDPKAGTFVQPQDRVAVFDNDGTLWAEQPVYFQFLFALDRAKALAAADPAWAKTPALKAAAAGDVKTLLEGGEAALTEVVFATHSGMTVEEFTREAGEWVRTAQHPTRHRTYIDMTYQPMRELLDYLRENGFTTYIVSGGGVDFMRGFTDEAYGVPSPNVVGSLGKATYQIVDGKPQVTKDPGIAFIDDKEGKPIGIMRSVGQRPIFAAGNSDGDYQMLDWTTAGDGPRFGIIVHHTDAAREWAYDRDSKVGRLDKALTDAPAKGWVVIDMAKDWKTVFAD